MFIITVVETIVLLIFLTKFFTYKKNIFFIFIIVSFLQLLKIIFFINEPTKAFFITFSIDYLSINLFFYEKNHLRKLFALLMFYVFSFIFDTFLICVYIFVFQDIMYENKINLVGSLSKVVLLFFVFNMKNILYEEKHLKKWLILCFFPVICMLILIYILPYALKELNFTITKLITIIAFLSLMLKILLIHFLAKKAIIEKQKNDLKTLEKIKNANTEKFLKIRNSYKDTEKLAHDIKKHIDYIYYAKSLAEVKQYISEITQKRYSNLSIYTGNFDIDTILTIYEKDIKITSSSTLPNIIYWTSGVDLNIIIGNVIENATRYSSYIKVSFKYNDNWLLISTENYTDKNSKKINKGLGTLNIEETLKKYDGNLKYKVINNIFYTDILLQNQVLKNEVR